MLEGALYSVFCAEYSKRPQYHVFGFIVLSPQFLMVVLPASSRWLSQKNRSKNTMMVLQKYHYITIIGYSSCIWVYVVNLKDLMVFSAVL